MDTCWCLGKQGNQTYTLAGKNPGISVTPKTSRASAGNRNRCPGQSLLAVSTQESVKHKGVWSHLLERTGISDPAPNEKHFVQVSPQPNSTTTGLAGSFNLLTIGPCIVLELLACVHGVLFKPVFSTSASGPCTPMDSSPLALPDGAGRRADGFDEDGGERYED